MKNDLHKKILVMDGHPDAESFCAAITKQYIAGVKISGYSFETLIIRDLEFDAVLHYGYRKIMQLEPDLLEAQEKIRRCDHLVVILPVWWGGIPSHFKGFIDRTFISGFSHRFNLDTGMPEGLLGGRSASILYTQGAPWFYSLLIRNDSFWKMIKGAVFGYCGFKPIKRKYFDKAKSGTDADRETILKQVYDLGMKGF